MTVGKATRIGNIEKYLAMIEKLKSENQRLRKQNRFYYKLAKVWKQTAKKWFHRGEIAEGLNILHAIALEKERYKADRRLELLIRATKGQQYCLVCGRYLIAPKEKQDLEVGHTDDCELAKELNG